MQDDRIVSLVDESTENAVLGCILNHHHAAKYAFDNLPHLAFFNLRKQYLYRFMEKLFINFGAVESSVIRGRIKTMKVKKQDDYEQILDQIEKPDFQFSTGRIDEYVEILNKLHYRRIALMKVESLKAAALDPAQDIESAFMKVENAFGKQPSTASQIGNAESLIRELEDAVEGRRKCMHMPWPIWTEFSQALTPGSMFTICGSPGSSKSLALNQIIYHLIDQCKVAALVLEETPEYHMRRMMAQLSGNSFVTRDNWCAVNQDKMWEIRDRYAKELLEFGQCLHQKHRDEAATAEWVLRWIQNRLLDGYRVLAIDPYTYIEMGDRATVEEPRFINRAKTLIEDCGASLIFITHPRKTGQNFKGTFSMDDLAGSATLSRRSTVVAWLGMHHPKLIKCDPGEPGSEPRDVVCNRTISVFKARNGRSMSHIGFWFNPEDLTMHERGEIVEIKKPAKGGEDKNSGPPGSRRFPTVGGASR